MRTRVIHLHGQPGCGKTSALLSLIDHAIDARSRPRVFVSFNFDDLLDGKHQLRAILDGLDEEPTASGWIDPGSPFQLLLGAGLSSALTPVGVSTFDLPVHMDAPAATMAGQPMCPASLRAFLRSALRQIDRLISLVLSLARQPDYPVSEFLIEPQWFLLHGTHPPRPLRTAAADLSSGRLCSELVSAR